MFKIYAKLTNDHMLAHLYEHMIFDYLEGKLQDEGLVSVLDKYMIPETSFDGLITLSFEFIEAKAQMIVERALRNDREAITEGNIKRCAGQISCEELSRIDFDVSEVEDALLKIADQPWHDMYEGYSIDVGHPAKTRRSKDESLLVSVKAPNFFDHIYIDYVYTGQQEDPVRLYVLDQLVGISQDEFRHRLAQAGLVAYWRGTHYQRNKKKVRISQELVLPAPARKLEKDMWQILEDTMENLRDGDIEARLARHVHRYKQSTSSFVTMNFDLYAHLGVLVGAEEIARAVTEELVMEVTNNLTMSGRIVEAKPDRH